MHTQILHLETTERESKCQYSTKELSDARKTYIHTCIMVTLMPLRVERRISLRQNSRSTYTIRSISCTCVPVSLSFSLSASKERHTHARARISSRSITVSLALPWARGATWWAVRVPGLRPSTTIIVFFNRRITQDRTFTKHFATSRNSSSWSAAHDDTGAAAAGKHGVARASPTYLQQHTSTRRASPVDDPLVPA